MVNVLILKQLQATIKKSIQMSQDTSISKLLSLVLRHKPEVIGIALDQNGWTDVKQLLEKLNAFGKSISLEELFAIVSTSDKQRFALNETKDKIRANQGHSIPIDLAYKATTPPDFLFHGTSEKSLASILQNGIEKRDRHHVHLSKDIPTAMKVGIRHGKPVILEIRSKKMHDDGYLFFISDNGVWLTDFVPPKYFNRKDQK